jgi:rod shape-determining protein MreC
MIDRELGQDRTLPLFITLIVISFLVMTFDVRLQGRSVVGTLRSGAQTLLAPLQDLASWVIDPVADLGGALFSVATLQAENEAFRAELAKYQGLLAKVEDDLARKAVLEELYNLEFDLEAARTEANVIGRPSDTEASFLIDKGSSDGIREDNPVIDASGNLVGKISLVSPDYATVIPITHDRDAITVLVGGQPGILSARLSPSLTSLQVPLMTLDVYDARQPLLAGEKVVTSSISVGFPPGIVVGEVAADAALEGTALSAQVHPFSEIGKLRVVVVLAWPVDPNSFEEIAAVTTTNPGG